MRTNCGHGEKKKSAKLFITNNLALLNGTQSRDRTGMEVNPLVFETSASTNSAIWAFCRKAIAKVHKNFKNKNG